MASQSSMEEYMKYMGCGDVPYLCSLRYDAMLWGQKALSLCEVLYNYVVN